MIHTLAIFEKKIKKKQNIVSLYNKKAFPSIQYGSWTIWGAVNFLKSHNDLRTISTVKPYTHLMHTGHNAASTVLAKSDNFRISWLIKDINLKKSHNQSAAPLLLALIVSSYLLCNNLFGFLEHVKILNNPQKTIE